MDLKFPSWDHTQARGVQDRYLVSKSSHQIQNTKYFQMLEVPSGQTPALPSPIPEWKGGRGVENQEEVVIGHRQVTS